MEDYREHLNLINESKQLFMKKNIRKLEQLFRALPRYLEDAIKLFIRKSLIKEYRYNYPDGGDEQFTLPDESVIVKGDQDEFHKRVLMLERAYTFQANVLEKATDLSEDFLDQCRNMLGSFNFSRPEFQNINTRNYKDLLDKLLQLKEPNTVNMARLNQKTLADTHAEARTTIEEVSRFKKDFYKLNIRFVLLKELPEQFSFELFNSDRDSYIESLAEYMAIKLPELSFIDYYIEPSLYDFYNLDDEEALEKFKDCYLTDRESHQVEFIPSHELHKLLRGMPVLLKPLLGYYRYLEKSYKSYLYSKMSFVKKLRIFASALLKINYRSYDPFEVYFFDPIERKIVNRQITFDSFTKGYHELVNTLKDLEDRQSELNIKLQEFTVKKLVNRFCNIFLDTVTIKEQMIGIENEFLTALKEKIENNKETIDFKRNIELSMIQFKKRYSIINRRLGIR